MFRAWDDAVRVLTGRPTGSRVTGEVFEVLESDDSERSIQYSNGATRSYGYRSFSDVVQDDERQNMRGSKAKLQ